MLAQIDALCKMMQFLLGKYVFKNAKVSYLGDFLSAMPGSHCIMLQMLTLSLLIHYSAFYLH